MKHFLTTRGLSQTEFESLLGARRGVPAGRGKPRVLRRQARRPRVLQPVAAHARLDGDRRLEARRHARLPVRRRRRLGDGVRDGVVMDGAAASTCARGPACSGATATCSGVRSFPKGKDYEKDRREPVLNGLRELLRRAGGQPRVAARPPVPGDGRRMTHPAAARRRKRAAASCSRGRTTRRRFQWRYRTAFLLGASRLGVDLVLARPEGYDLDPEIVEAARAERPGLGWLARGDRGRRDGVRGGVEVVYAKSWGALADYGKPEAEAARRARLRDWRVTEQRMAARPGRNLHALPARAPQRRRGRRRPGRARAPPCWTRRRTGSTPSRRSWSGWRGEELDEHGRRRSRDGSLDGELAARGICRTSGGSRARTSFFKISGKVTEHLGSMASLAEEIALLQQVGHPHHRRARRGPAGDRALQRLGARDEALQRPPRDRRRHARGRQDGLCGQDLRRDPVRAASFGVHAVGVSGIDGNVVLARRRAKKRLMNPETGKREMVDFGNVGDVVERGSAPSDDAARRAGTCRSSRRSRRTKRARSTTSTPTRSRPPWRWSSRRRS